MLTIPRRACAPQPSWLCPPPPPPRSPLSQHCTYLPGATLYLTLLLTTDAVGGRTEDDRPVLERGPPPPRLLHVPLPRRLHDAPHPTLLPAWAARSGLLSGPALSHYDRPAWAAGACSTGLPLLPAIPYARSRAGGLNIQGVSNVHFTAGCTLAHYNLALGHLNAPHCFARHPCARSTMPHTRTLAP